MVLKCLNFGIFLGLELMRCYNPTRKRSRSSRYLWIHITSTLRNFKNMCKIQTIRILKLYKDLIRYGEQLTLTDKTYYRERIRKEFKNNKYLQNESEITHSFEVRM